ncbi:hypothetical protein [Tuwongella immobilis]|uniref:Uncharacterized protein n=1 Tax=Tuwongella immobilis TaxID=692036 RepID=A0A6C2YSB6_9BACT|nr:hypothetical protein [Tuwongella immobilis]VIP04568.1 unnamed protein product [Tuwongella immobilis]VTS06497.1 unnamed protein product [Tuwongella immobilis]
MAFEVILNQPNRYRVLLECYPEGVFVNLFEMEDSPRPIQDPFQPDLALAKQFCEDRFGIPLDAWVEIPDEEWH